MEETKIFLITYFAALLGVVVPGLVNLTVAKACMHHGRRNGVYVAIGASLVIFLQAFVAILLVKYIFDNPFVRNILLRAGLVIFIILGVYFYVMAKRNISIENESKKVNANSIFKGMLVAALNIFPIPYFAAIAAALDLGGEVSYNWLVIFVFSLAAAAGSFTTLYIYVVFFMKIEDKAETFSKYSNYFMAALMLVLVIVTIVRIYYS